jgi:hypothetical protein
MAQSGTTIRTKLNQRVFVSPPGTSMTYVPVSVSSATDGGYEGNTKTFGTGVATIVVPYGFISQRLDFKSIGLNAEGEMQLAVKYDVPVKSQDLFIGSLSAVYGTFVVQTVRPYPYDGVNLCTIITVKKQIF